MINDELGEKLLHMVLRRAGMDKIPDVGMHARFRGALVDSPFEFQEWYYHKKTLKSKTVQKMVSIMKGKLDEQTAYRLLAIANFVTVLNQGGAESCAALPNPGVYNETHGIKIADCRITGS